MGITGLFQAHVLPVVDKALDLPVTAVAHADAAVQNAAAGVQLHAIQYGP